MRAVCLLTAVVLGGCSGAGPGTPSARPGTGEPVALVNGVALGGAELALLSGGSGHGGADDRRPAILETLVAQELAAQQAVALGLDRDPAFLAAMEPVEAQYAVARRRALAAAWYRREVEARAAVDDEEARRYFDANAARLRAVYYVTQVFRRDRASIDAAAAALANGRPFEDVAAEGYPELPPGSPKPWAFGPVGDLQLPEPWRGPLSTLAAGAVSGVIEGDGGRFWILRLDWREEKPATTYESLAQGLKARLSAAKAEGLRAEQEAALRAAARVTYPSPDAR